MNREMKQLLCLVSLMLLAGILLLLWAEGADLGGITVQKGVHLG